MLSLAKVNAVQLVSAGQSGDLEVPNSGETIGGLGMTTSTVDEDRHLPDGLGEGCSLEVVTRDAARLSQAISDAEGSGVDVFEGSTQLDADLVVTGTDAIGSGGRIGCQPLGDVEVGAGESRRRHLSSSALIGLDGAANGDDRGE